MIDNHRAPFSSLAALLAVVVISCGPSRAIPDAGAPRAIDVQVARTSVQTLATTFDAGGTIRARTTANIASRLVAEVRAVRVAPGDTVKRGQVLVVVDDRDLAAARTRAQAWLAAAREGVTAAGAERESATARLSLARATFDRVSGLRSKNSATAQELDQATAGLRAAESSARGAEARLAEATAAAAAAGAASEGADVAASFATITAPFDGVITRKLVDQGDMVAPGALLLVMEDNGSLLLEARLDEARVRLVHVGASVSVEIDDTAGAPLALNGRVTEIARDVDPSAHSFVLKLALPAGAPVRSGMFGRARFAGDSRTGLAVAPAAIVRRGQLSLVYVVDAAGRARMRAVSVGATAGDAVEVLAGLDAGERVIVDPPASITDGAAVRVTGERP